MSLVQLRHIKKDYVAGEQTVSALRGINLTVAAGEMLAVMGTSGSGKSTLMNILGCLDAPSAGDYYLDSIHVNTLDNNTLADLRNYKLGFVFQGFNLLSRTTALENVELPLLYDRKKRFSDVPAKARAALDKVGLSARLHHFPSQLSGGQQQRVAIARALISEPQLLLADEPTGNLDSRTSLEIMALFQELNDQGITLLIVTHSDEIAAFAKRVIQLKDGVIIRDESIDSRRLARLELADS
jgi:putative ABC transport system ATP-binding protein